MGVRDYSVTAASNLSVQGISLAEGMARAAVNNGMRAQLADIANLLLDLGGATATTGSATAYLVALPSAPTAYADNLLFLATSHVTNSGAATININGIGTKDIKKLVDGVSTALAAGDFSAGHIGTFSYSSAKNAVILLNAGAYATLDEDGLIEQDTQFTHPDPPSALARPWVNRGREWCSPFDIITNQSDQDEILSGAGTFDATTQLQEAFLWAKRVEFPGGIQNKPCFLVSTSVRLQDDQTLAGNGCRIIIPDTGWALGSSDIHGVFNTKLRSRWRIEGFHFHFPDTMTALYGSMPKGIYYGGGTDGWIVNNLFEGHNYEVVWGGETVEGTSRLHFNHNVFIDCGLGALDWPYLPTLQINCMDSEAIGNTFHHCGGGVGNSGSRNAVIGNTIDDVAYVGIATGEIYSSESVIVGNQIRLFSHPTLPRYGILIDNGASDPVGGAWSVFEGNYIHIVATNGHASPTGIFVTSPTAAIGKNTITGEGHFVGIHVIPHSNVPANIDIDGLTVRAITETGPCWGIHSNHYDPDIDVTLRLRNCLVAGMGGLNHLNYTAGGSFVVGGVLTGGTSGYTGDIVNITVLTGTTGTIYLRNSTGTFTNGETITGSTGGSATAAETATSSYAYDIRATAPGVMNGSLDRCWKEGGIFRFGDVEHASDTYNNIPIQYGLSVWENTATYNPPSLAAGVVDTAQTMTVTAAALGDLVEVTFSLDLQGIVLRAWVSAANTVKYQFSCPAGGATIDLASGTVKCRVKK